MTGDLFHEDVYDALKGVVERCGGMKVVGHRLWPQKSPTAAGVQLANCLNRDRDEKLDPEQTILLLRLGHDVGYHGAKHWVDAECGYLPSAPVDPEDKIAALIREARVSFDGARRASEAFQRALAQYEQRPPAKPKR